MGQVLRRSAVRALVCAAQSRLLPSFLPPCFCHQPPLHLWLFIMTQVNLIAISLAAALNSLFRSLAFFFVRAAAISCKPTATPTPQHAYSPHEEASLSLSLSPARASFLGQAEPGMSMSGMCLHVSKYWKFDKNAADAC